ncbi:hypothetical protein ASE15_18540 [Oerskovia sp. Root22]|nr:hypothetical protein ASE15_18540 [Oerskovia sp. Root22]
MERARHRDHRGRLSRDPVDEQLDGRVSPSRHEPLREVGQAVDLLDVANARRDAPGEDRERHLGRDQPGDPPLARRDERHLRRTVAVAGRGGEREPVAAHAHGTEDRRERAPPARAAERTQHARAPRPEQRRRQHAGVEREPGRHPGHVERAAQGVLVGEVEGVDRAPPEGGQQDLARTAVGPWSDQAVDRPADRVRAVRLAPAEDHRDVDLLGTADQVVRTPGEQVREPRCDPHAQHGRGARLAGDLVEELGRLELAAGRRDVHERHAPREARPGHPVVARFDGQDDEAHPDERRVEGRGVREVDPFRSGRADPARRLLRRGEAAPGGHHPAGDGLGEPCAHDRAHRTVATDHEHVPCIH